MYVCIYVRTGVYIRIWLGVDHGYIYIYIYMCVCVCVCVCVCIHIGAEIYLRAYVEFVCDRVYFMREIQIPCPLRVWSDKCGTTTHKNFYQHTF